MKDKVSDVYSIITGIVMCVIIFRTNPNSVKIEGTSNPEMAKTGMYIFFYSLGAVAVLGVVLGIIGMFNQQVREWYNNKRRLIQGVLCFVSAIGFFITMYAWVSGGEM